MRLTVVTDSPSERPARILRDCRAEEDRMKDIYPEARSSHRSRHSGICLFVVAGIACLLLVRWADAQILTVENWASNPANAKGVPIGWKKLPDALPFLERQAMRVLTANYDFEIVANASEKVLRLKSAEEHSIIVKDLSGLDLVRTPLLEWKWRVDLLPRDANLSKDDKSDSAAEIHIVWRASKRTIGYAWDETLPVDSHFANPRRREVHFVIVTSGKARPGEWIPVTRDMLSDYRKIYGTELSDPPDQIAISVDSNQTRSKAESFVGTVRFRAR
jgi:hypothetical protein